MHARRRGATIGGCAKVARRPDRQRLDHGNGYDAPSQAVRLSECRRLLIETILAGLTLAVCGVLAVRLLIGERRRWRFDAWLRKRGANLQRLVRKALQWRSTRRTSAEAADAAIRRARGGQWDGNVYRPRSFRGPRKPH